MMREFLKKFLYDFSREKYTYISLVFASIALNLTELVQTFQVPFYKLLRVEDFWNRKNVSRVCSPCFFRSLHKFSMGLRSVLCDDTPVQRLCSWSVQLIFFFHQITECGSKSYCDLWFGSFLLLLEKCLLTCWVPFQLMLV